MRHPLLGLLISCVAVSAADPYAAWSAGRPAESLTALRSQAESSDRWQDWLDLGLCAAAAEERGEAVAALLRAHTSAPYASSPREALTALAATPRPGWIDILGPLSVPGTGWPGVIVALIAGCSLGLALADRRHRVLASLVATGSLLACGPGLIAWWHDVHRSLASTLRDTHLLDSSGHPVAALPEGTVLECHGDLWSGRILVTTTEGRQGRVPVQDLSSSR